MAVSSNPLRIGIVGCGGIAQVIHLPILAKMPEVDLVALCDLDDRKTAFLSKRFSISNTFRDIEEMFRKVEMDVLFILTPTNMHLPMSYIALRNGAHLFIERPCARNVGETRKIQLAAKKAGREVMVGMHSRFRNDFRTIRGFLDNKTLGDTAFIRAEWLQSRLETTKQPWLMQKTLAGGGVLMDLGVQLLDACWWISGRPLLKSVHTTSRQIDTRLETEDFANVFLRFEGDIDVSISVSWNFPLLKDRLHMEVFGVDGTARVTPFKIEKFHRGKTLDLTPPIYETYPGAVYKLAYHNEIQHFINFLTGRETRLISSIDEAVTVMDMMGKVYESLHSGKTVHTSPTADNKA